VHAVRELVIARPALVDALYVATGRHGSDVSDTVACARRAGLVVERREPEFLSALSHGGQHQGLAARMAPFSYTELDVITRARPQLIIALDCVQDPRNLGAILRTAEAVAAGGVLIPKDRSAGVTGAAVRSAAGHVFRVPIARVTNLARVIGKLKAEGWWAMALMPRAGEVLHEMRLPDRVLLVIGGEGTSIRPLVVSSCDCRVALPMAYEIGRKQGGAAGRVRGQETSRA
jgi:23S rRNA (guanosine2251-2'-O)-methyltransferase